MPATTIIRTRTSAQNARQEGEGTGQVALRHEELTNLCDDVDLERDRALVERCQTGDSAAFENLYARYHGCLFHFCLRRLHDRHEAEDAAQEAFARAWKALPRFAGERRFYPWLRVIAGNICTDTLRRRSRTTPTDDVERTARPPVGVVGEVTSEELVLAAADGELVNEALGRLSARHRRALALREQSGWSYQQIAEHEGVEVGTIETLLWRARQALKREFAVVSNSKGALAGFLVATGALIRRVLVRAGGRGAGAHHQGGASDEGLRNVVSGVALTGATVTAALLAPHALSASPASARGGPGSIEAAPHLVVRRPPAGGGPVGSPPGTPSGAPGGRSADTGTTPRPNGTGTGSDDGSPSSGDPVGGGPGAPGSVLGGTSGGSSGGLSSGLYQLAGGVATSLGAVANGAGSTAGTAVGGGTSGIRALTQTLGLGGLLPGSSASGSGTPGSGSGSSLPRAPIASPVGGIVGVAVSGLGGAVAGTAVAGAAGGPVGSSANPRG
jgi:RNA polymerase sigma-70 factor (ECF subfamily)